MQSKEPSTQVYTASAVFCILTAEVKEGSSGIVAEIAWNAESYSGISGTQGVMFECAVKWGLLVNDAVSQL